MYDSHAEEGLLQPIRILERTCRDQKLSKEQARKFLIRQAL